MVALTANGLYGDRARGLFGMNSGGNGSAASSTSAQAVMERTYSSIAKMASDSISSNKQTIQLLMQQVGLLKKLSNKDGGLSLSDLLVAKYLGKFAAGAAAAMGGAAGAVKGLAGGAARTIGNGLQRMFQGLSRNVLGGIGTVFGSVSNMVSRVAAPMMQGIKSIASFATFTNATKTISSIVKALPTALGFLTRGLGKLLWPITAIMGAFDGIKGAFDADKILGRNGTTVIEKVRTGLAQAVNGIFLGLPDWLSEKAGFKNFAVLNDKIAEASRAMQAKMGDLLSEGLTSFSTAVSDGFTRFKDKLASLGNWAKEVLGMGPDSTPQKIANAREAGANVGNIFANADNNKSSAVDVKGLMSADRLDKLKENLLANPATRDSVSTNGTIVAKTAVITSSAAVQTIQEVGKAAVEQSADSIEAVQKKAIQGQDSLLKKILGGDIADAFAGAIGGLEKAAGTLQGDMAKSAKDAAGGIAAYLGGGVSSNFIGAAGGNVSGALPGGFSARGNGSGSFVSQGQRGNSNFAYTGLGSVAEKYESGGRGVGTISSGAGDAGGVSYGKHQLATNNGSMSKFLAASGYDKQFAGLQPGTAEFNAKYSEIAKSDPKFADAQKDYIKTTHYDVANQRLKDAGMDLSGRGKAVQEAIFSTAVQYGPNKDLVQRALKDRDVSKMSDEEIVSAIQSNKRANVATDFKSSPGLHTQLVDRMTREEQDLVALARGKDKAGSSDSITMANAGKTRDQDIKPELKTQLEYAAAQSGVKVEVTSGGQAAIGTGGKRTGSTRHDEGGAADLKLYRVDQNGKKQYLDMNNPADAEVMKQFTTNSVKAGASGVGAGYMGGQTLHVGGGTNAAWGGAPWINDALKDGIAGRKGFDVNQWKEANSKTAEAVTQVQQSYEDKMKAAGFSQQSPFGKRNNVPMTPGINNLPDPATDIGKAVGKAISEEVKAPKQPEFVPSITTPLQQSPTTPTNSTVSKNPTGAPKDGVSAANAPNVRDVPSIDELSMLLPNSTMMS